MLAIHRRAALAIFLSIPAVTGLGAAERPTPVGEPGELAAKATAGRLIFAGQPSAEGLRAAAAEGVRVVINLRTDEEVAALPFDEPALVEELGMRYLSLPVSGSTFGVEQVRRFAEEWAALQDDPDDGKVLLHCGSSNRVGALWAGYLVLEEELPLAEALEHGTAAGMRSPELAHRVRAMAGEPTGD